MWQTCGIVIEQDHYSWKRHKNQKLTKNKIDKNKKLKIYLIQNIKYIKDENRMIVKV